ncbi:MAG: SOS response-associated peptidase [Saprospiraceae bacterium]
MCGRYSLVINEDKLRKKFGPAVQLPTNLEPNYNVAPTQQGLVLTDRHPDQMGLFRWGLVPHWAKDLSVGARMINARSEGIEDKASFREPIRKHRCLVIADSFYEWKREGKAKQPYRLLPDDGSLLIMAGIWSSWKPKDDDEAEYTNTYSIITGPPNADTEDIHDRMPMLLRTDAQISVWLDPRSELDTVLSLLQPPPAGTLRAYPVNPLVGNVRNNGEELHHVYAEAEA